MFTRTEIQSYAVVFTAEVGEDHTGRRDAFDVILDMPSLTVHDDLHIGSRRGRTRSAGAFP